MIRGNYSCTNKIFNNFKPFGLIKAVVSVPQLAKNRFVLSALVTM